MLAKRQKPAPGRISVRYYHWSPDGLHRITEKLHRELLQQKMALPQFAASNQKILELLVERQPSGRLRVAARGIVYPFDRQGKLDVRKLAIEGSMDFSRSLGTNVVDLYPTIKRRRFEEQYKWKLERAILNAVLDDIRPRSKKTVPHIPFLRPIANR